MTELDPKVPLLGPEDAQEDAALLLKLRTLRPEDYPDVQAAMLRIYEGKIADPSIAVLSEHKYRAQLQRFPEGQLCIEDNGRVVAAAFSLVVDYERFGDNHTYAQITGNGYLSTHDPEGDTLYGVEVFVDPEYRTLRLGRRLYAARKELCRNLNLRGIIFGGRIPGYDAHAGEMRPHEYIERVERKELYDPVLSFQLANEFAVRRLLRNYLPSDAESHGYATLLEWNNVYYEPRERPLVGGRKTNVRVGVVQWQMRRVASVDELLEQVEFFVDAVADYRADFVVFPEFFNVPLLGLVDQSHAVEAMRKLADFTPQLCQALADYAVRYNINIVGGSFPVVEDDELYNVAYLFRRDGTSDCQYKIHITPFENRHWRIKGGSDLKVFDTDAGRVGILICYDSEFPELSRILADRGMQILFIPFWTETKNGYQRVSRCAQARAIENECYVVISGSVGNLPRVDNVNVHYAQSAVFSPSDFAFPHDSVIAETTPNTEMMVIVDLDLGKLHQLHNEGGVQNLKDRRLDLYHLQWLGRPVLEATSDSAAAAAPTHGR